MAITQLKPGYNPGAQLGGAIGSGLSSLFQGLAEGKVRQMQQQQQREESRQQQQQRADLLKQAGYGPQDIALANLIPQSDLLTFLTSYQPGGQTQQEGQMDSLQQVMQQLSQQAQEQPPQITLQDILGGQPQQQNMIMRALGQTQVQQPTQQQQEIQQLQQLLGEQQMQPQVQQKAPSKYGKFESPAEKALKAKQQFQREKEERQVTREEQKEISKETLPYYQELTKSAKAAKDSNMRLDRMQKLVDRGKLQSNVFIRGLDSLSRVPYIGPFAGAIEAAFLNRDSQEFKKLSTDFLKDAKSFFGNRITQKEIELFLDTVPTLVQTDPGKIVIINNMRLFNEGALIRKKAANEIIRKNNGFRPRNLDELVDKFSEKELDRIAKKFRGGLAYEESNTRSRPYKIFEKPLFLKS
jgi:hypothetical protein